MTELLLKMEIKCEFDALVAIFCSNFCFKIKKGHSHGHGHGDHAAEDCEDKACEEHGHGHGHGESKEEHGHG